MQGDAIVHQLRIRNDDGDVAHRRQGGVAPAYADDLSRDAAVHLDPVADAIGVVELKRNAAHQVAQRRLQCKAERRSAHGCRGNEARQIHADCVQTHEREDDQRQRYRHLAENARHGLSRQDDVDQERYVDPDVAQRDDQQADLARHDRDGEARRNDLVVRQQREPAKAGGDQQQGHQNRAAKLRPQARRDQPEKQRAHAEGKRFLQRDQFDHR